MPGGLLLCEVSLNCVQINRWLNQFPPNGGWEEQRTTLSSSQDASNV